MTDAALIIVATVLVNNVVLVQFLGLCPFMGVSGQLDSTLGMGAATSFVLTLASGLAYLLDRWVLLPFEITWLRPLGFIVVIALVVQFTEITIRRRSERLHQLLGLYLPLITTNCAVLGVALLAVRRYHSLLDALLYGFAAAIGFTLVLFLFALLRERIAQADVPLAFRGSPIALITAGIMSLAFMGFSGIVRA